LTDIGLDHHLAWWMPEIRVGWGGVDRGSARPSGDHRGRWLRGVWRATHSAASCTRCWRDGRRSAGRPVTPARRAGGPRRT